MNITNKIAILLFCLTMGLQTHAQGNDSTGLLNLYNEEYDVVLKVDTEGEGMLVADHELYGRIPGFLGKSFNSFYWLIISITKKGNTSEFQMVNDYGSEDLIATLTPQNDSTYVLNQHKGSTIKLPHKGKWQKLPKQLTFQRKEQTDSNKKRPTK